MTKKTKEVIEQNNKVPSYIKQGSNRGSENVEMDDYIIPRVELLQDLSPQLKKNKPNYIPEAEAGMMFNTVTQKVYGDCVIFVPVKFKKDFLVWRDRESGGGFRGSFDSAAEANAHAEALNAEDNQKYDVVDTAQHIILVINEDGTTDEAVLSMSRSKMKVSRNFNSLIRLNGGDRFSRTYQLTPVEDSSDKGDYWNYLIKNHSFPEKKTYLKAEKLYTDMTSGNINVKVDETFDETGSENNSDIPF